MILGFSSGTAVIVGVLYFNQCRLRYLGFFRDISFVKVEL